MPAHTRIVPFSRNARFLQNIFGDPGWLQSLVAWFPGDPEKTADWTAYPATALPDATTQRTMNTYFCPSLVKGTERQVSEFVSFHVIVVDDIGTSQGSKLTKGHVESVLGPAHYLIETSPANFQAGWRTEPLTDLGWVKGMLKRLKEVLGAGDNLTDPVIWRRLPIGINGKAKYREDSSGLSWAVMLTENPRMPLPLAQADLDLVLGTITPVNVTVTGLGEMPDPGEIEGDVILEVLGLLGRILDHHIRPTTMGWGVDIECPWSEDHTDRVQEGAVYVPVKERFHCHHGHCQDRTSADLRQRVDELLRDDSGGLDSLARHEFDEIKPEDTPGPGTTAGPQSDGTEDGVAQVFASIHEGRLKFDHTRKRWFRWAESFWRQDEVEHAFRWARQLARKARNQQDLTPGQVRTMGKIAFAGAVERAARADHRLAVDGLSWDQDPWLAGAPGCEIDLKTGEIKAADPKHVITRQLLVAPLKMPIPIWEQFIWDSTGGDMELIDFLQAWSGYGLTGDTAEEKFVFFYGPGGNGKGTFLFTISAILNDYAARTPADTFMVRKTEAHPTEIARLAGVRMVTAAEIEEGRTFNAGRLKDFTGRDGKLMGRFMRQDWFQFVPQFKVNFVGNNQPRLTNVDDAMRRRMVLVPFLLVPKVVDITLKDRLVAEYPGILSWMIEGENRRRTVGGLSALIPATATKATQVYLDSQDTLKAWTTECCEVEDAI